MISTERRVNTKVVRSPEGIETAYVQTIKRLYPRGLNPHELSPRNACRNLQYLDSLDRRRTFQLVTTEAPPDKAVLLAKEIRQIAEMGGRRLGKHPHHRHPV